jgi:hypothetical protein
VQSLPESVIVPPRQGLRPVRNDELRLRLLGIEACKGGGSEDTARFVRLLRWLAEREEAYEPPADSDEDMPQVTSEEIAEYLGLTDESDRLSLDRLRVLLGLDHWSVSTGSLGDGWYAVLAKTSGGSVTPVRRHAVGPGRPALMTSPLSRNTGPMKCWFTWDKPAVDGRR